MVRDIFSRGFHTHTDISSQFSISIYIRGKYFRSQSHCEHAVCIPDRIFLSFAPSQNSPTPTLPRIIAYDRFIPSFTHAVLQFSHTRSIRRSHFGSNSAFDGHSLAAFPLPILPRCPCPPFSRTIAFLQHSLTLSIGRSHFGSFLSLSAFDGRILAAFPLRIHPRCPCPPHSTHSTVAFCQFCSFSVFNGRVLAAFPLRILPRCHCPEFTCTIPFFLLLHTLSIQRSHFGRFCTISAFDGRVLAGFAQSLHLTVAFWQLFLFAFSHPAPAPRSRIRSHCCSFRSLLAFNGRSLAGFAQCLHSTVAFWQVLHNLCIRRSRFGSFSSPHSPTPHLPPVLAYDRIFAAFAHSQH